MIHELYSILDGDDSFRFNRDHIIGDYQFDSNGD